MRAIVDSWTPNCPRIVIRVLRNLWSGDALPVLGHLLLNIYVREKYFCFCSGPYLAVLGAIPGPVLKKEPWWCVGGGELNHVTTTKTYKRGGTQPPGLAHQLEQYSFIYRCHLVSEADCAHSTFGEQWGLKPIPRSWN